MIEVLNRRTLGAIPRHETYVYCGRPSPLGNPFVVGHDGHREEVIQKYSNYFEEQMNKKLNPHGYDFRDEFFRLVDIYKRNGILKLICYCAPAKCHCDVLKGEIEERV